MAKTKTNESGMLTGLFYDRNSAERAYTALSERGYSKDDINVVMSDDARKRHFSDDGATTELGNKAAEGAGIGGAVGGTLGAVLAAVTATGTSLALPGLGLVIAGPLAAAAAGAGAGAATGGLLGALIGWGIPEERVKHYESGIKDGGILIGVTPRSEEDAAYLESQWRNNNGHQIWRNGSADGAAYSGQTLTSSGADTANGGGMQHGDTVVAVYDDRSHAEQTMRELASAGFSRDRIRMNPDDVNEVAGQQIDGDQISYAGVKDRTNMEYLGDHDVYSEAVRRGSYVVSVEASGEDDVERAMEIMSRHDAIDIEERSTHWRNEGWSGYDRSAPRYTRDQIDQERTRHMQLRSTAAGSATEGTRIPVIEEELKVGKRQVQRGGVRVVKRMRETPVHESVQLREEHVKVERHRVDQPATEADLAAFKEQSIEMREMAEEAVVQKTARVVEEVVIGKEVSQETRNIKDTVRRTDVEVEQLGAGSRGTDDDTDFRRHWQSAYGHSGGRYEDYDDAYRYGSTMAGSDRYRNYQWNDVEPQLRSDWEANHPESTWDKVKDAVRYGAERVTGNRRH